MKFSLKLLKEGDRLSLGFNNTARELGFVLIWDSPEKQYILSIGHLTDPLQDMTYPIFFQGAL